MAPFPVYSTRFFANLLVNSSVAFLVPGGYIAVVRHVDCSQTSPGGFICQVGIAGHANFFSVDMGLTTTVSWASWAGRQVLNAGEQLVANGVGTGDVVASGYLLTTP